METDRALDINQCSKMAGKKVSQSITTAGECAKLFSLKMTGVDMITVGNLRQLLVKAGDISLTECSS